MLPVTRPVKRRNRSHVDFHLLPGEALPETSLCVSGRRKTKQQTSVRMRASEIPDPGPLAVVNAEALETYSTPEGNAQLPTQKSRRHELRPGTTKLSYSPGRPLTSRISVRRLEISTSLTSEDAANLAHRPSTVPRQSSRPSGSLRKETVSLTTVISLVCLLRRRGSRLQPHSKHLLLFQRTVVG